MDGSNPYHEFYLKSFPSDRHLALPPINLKSEIFAAEFLGYLCITNIAAEYRYAFKCIDFHCHIIKTDEIVVKSLKSGSLSLAIFSTGAFNIIASICARVAYHFQSKFNLDFPFQIRRIQPRRTPSFQIGSFLSDEASVQYTDLTYGNVRESLKFLTPLGIQCAIELFSAAIEFLTLHEAAHCALQHQEVRTDLKLLKSLQSLTTSGPKNDVKIPYDSEIHLGRLFEYHADYFAYSQMFFNAPARPIMRNFSEPFVERVFFDKTSRRMAGILGCSIAIAFILLSDSGWENGRICPRYRARGLHPPPLLRLQVANSLLIGSLESKLRRLILWPNSLLAKYDVILFVAEIKATFSAIAALHADWQSAVVLHSPAKDWASWLQALFHNRNEQGKILITKELYDDINSLDRHSRRIMNRP